MKIADLALMRLTSLPCNCKLTSLNFVKKSVDCDSQDIVSMHPLTVTFYVQQHAYKLSSSLSECTTLPKLIRTLLNPLVSFEQSIHYYSATFLVNFEFRAVRDWA